MTDRDDGLLTVADYDITPVVSEADARSIAEDVAWSQILAGRGITAAAISEDVARLAGRPGREHGTTQRQ